MKKLRALRVIDRESKFHRILSIAQISLLGCLIFVGTRNVVCQETEPAGKNAGLLAEASNKTNEFVLKPGNFYRDNNLRTGDSFPAPRFPRNTSGWLKPFPDGGFRPAREPEPQKEISDDDADPQTESKGKFHWKAALIQSGIFLGIQHAARFTQGKTRRQLPGPFFADWGRSVKSLRGWKDGDTGFINYIAHPLQGGLTGRIYVNNSDSAKQQEFGKSKLYWQSRLKALAWSAVWSAQFELGPISEATIGNVGIIDRKTYSEMAYVDLVMTPVAGTALMIGEDAIDKYVLKNWIERKSGKVNMRVKLLRCLLTPTTAFANLLRGKPPWKRDDRK
jgi:hypothetical protein